jgi:hypothetical protein
MQTCHFNGLLVTAILLISTAPLYAQRQQLDVAKLKADARNVVGAVGANKDKTKIYCQILDLTEQAEEVKQEKNSKKAMTVSQQMCCRRNWVQTLSRWFMRSTTSIQTHQMATNSL